MANKALDKSPASVIHPGLPEDKHFYGPPWSLRMQAVMWRFLMAIGMFIGRLAPPRPMKPAFTRTIPTTLSPNSGSVKIHFYVPIKYELSQALQTKKRYPCIVNFHGGGFTIGSATDDARWASTVVQELDAIVASVDYRLAPEHPFPTAVEDGVDAIMYLSKHADELLVDTEKIAVSGFSSGGNMSFTVPLRLQEELEPDFKHGNTQDLPQTTSPLKSDPQGEAAGSITIDNIDGPSRSLEEGQNDDEDRGSPSSSVAARPARKSTTIVRVSKPVKIAAIVSWYPSTDYTQTRDERRATNLRKDMELSATFTSLFDSSYLQPPTMNMSNPYLSPGVAPVNILETGLPTDIVMFICEYDMLAAEGKRMRDRLEELGKNVYYTEVKGVPHGWDKAPNPLSEPPMMREHYRNACRDLKQIFKRQHRELHPGRKSGDWGRRSIDSVRRSITLPRQSFGLPRLSMALGSQRRGAEGRRSQDLGRISFSV